MRLLIAGWQGQIARGLVEAAPACPDVKACAVGRAALDICEARSIERALAQIEPTIVINSAAYTAVDKAETDAGARLCAQPRRRAHAGRGGGAARHPHHPHLDRLRVRRAQGRALRRGRRRRAGDGVRPLQARRRGRGRGSQPAPRDLAHRRGSSVPTGRNFVKTMLAQAAERHQRARRRRPARQPHLRAASRRRDPGAGAAAVGAQGRRRVR